MCAINLLTQICIHDVSFEVRNDLWLNCDPNPRCVSNAGETNDMYDDSYLDQVTILAR